MSKTINWATPLLVVLVLVLISWNLVNTNTTPTHSVVDTQKPTYQSEYTTTMVYNLNGELNYKLVADHVDHFAEKQITWFTQPIATTFDNNKVPIWILRADKGKLIQNRMLYLYGHVKVNSLNNNLHLKYITTDNATINLITQDISSDNEVTLHGANFNSTSMKMRGNLRNKTAKLIEKVHTSYEIHNSKYTP